MNLIKSLKNDYYAAFGKPATIARLFVGYLLCAGFKAVVLYRISFFLQKFRLGRLGLLLSAYSVSKTGADISPLAEIGDYFVIKHPIGIVIGRSVSAGSNLTLLQGVTIGENYRIANRGICPKLGYRVTICSNSVVVGPIEIGDDVLIAANSFVSTSLDEGMAYVGTPALARRVHTREEVYWRFEQND